MSRLTLKSLALLATLSCVGIACAGTYTEKFSQDFESADTYTSGFNAGTVKNAIFGTATSTSTAAPDGTPTAQATRTIYGKSTTSKFYSSLTAKKATSSYATYQFNEEVRALKSYKLEFDYYNSPCLAYATHSGFSINGPTINGVTPVIATFDYPVAGEKGAVSTGGKIYSADNASGEIGSFTTGERASDPADSNWAAYWMHVIVIANEDGVWMSVKSADETSTKLESEKIADGFIALDTLFYYENFSRNVESNRRFGLDNIVVYSLTDSATFTWTGSAGDNKWTTAGNWTASENASPYPEIGDTVNGLTTENLAAMDIAVRIDDENKLVATGLKNEYIWTDADENDHNWSTVGNWKYASIDATAYETPTSKATVTFPSTFTEGTEVLITKNVSDTNAGGAGAGMTFNVNCALVLKSNSTSQRMINIRNINGSGSIALGCVEIRIYQGTGNYNIPMEILPSSETDPWGTSVQFFARASDATMNFNGEITGSGCIQFAGDNSAHKREYQNIYGDCSKFTGKVRFGVNSMSTQSNRMRIRNGGDFSKATIQIDEMATVNDLSADTTIKVGSLIGGGQLCNETAYKCTLEIGDAGVSTFNGTLTKSSDTTADWVVNKVGKGILNRSDATTYTGLTEVCEGTLAISAGHAFSGAVKIGEKGVITVGIDSTTLTKDQEVTLFTAKGLTFETATDSLETTVFLTGNVIGYTLSSSTADDGTITVKATVTDVTNITTTRKVTTYIGVGDVWIDQDKSYDNGKPTGVYDVVVVPGDALMKLWGNQDRTTNGIKFGDLVIRGSTLKAQKGNLDPNLEIKHIAGNGTLSLRHVGLQSENNVNMVVDSGVTVEFSCEDVGSTDTWACGAGTGIVTVNGPVIVTNGFMQVYGNVVFNGPVTIGPYTTTSYLSNPTTINGTWTIKDGADFNFNSKSVTTGENAKLVLEGSGKITNVSGVTFPYIELGTGYDGTLGAMNTASSGYIVAGGTLRMTPTAAESKGVTLKSGMVILDVSSTEITAGTPITITGVKLAEGASADDVTITLVGKAFVTDSFTFDETTGNLTVTPNASTDTDNVWIAGAKGTFETAANWTLGTPTTDQRIVFNNAATVSFTTVCDIGTLVFNADVTFNRGTGGEKFHVQGTEGTGTLTLDNMGISNINGTDASINNNINMINGAWFGDHPYTGKLSVYGKITGSGDTGIWGNDDGLYLYGDNSGYTGRIFTTGGHRPVYFMTEQSGFSHASCTEITGSFKLWIGEGTITFGGIKLHGTGGHGFDMPAAVRTGKGLTVVFGNDNYDCTMDGNAYQAYTWDDVTYWSSAGCEQLTIKKIGTGSFTNTMENDYNLVVEDDSTVTLTGTLPTSITAPANEGGTVTYSPTTTPETTSTLANLTVSADGWLTLKGTAVNVTTASLAKSLALENDMTIGTLTLTGDLSLWGGKAVTVGSLDANGKTITLGAVGAQLVVPKDASVTVVSNPEDTLACIVKTTADNQDTYTATAIIGVTVNGTDNATLASVTTNGVEVTAQDGKYYVIDGATVVATYTAAEGYLPATIEASITASTTTTEITVADTDKPYLGAAKIGTTAYATLTNAIAEAKTDDTVTLLQNADTTAQIEIADKAITLDLAGMTITYTGADFLWSGVLLVHNGASLTIDDTSMDKTGKITSTKITGAGPADTLITVDHLSAYAAIALTKKGDDATKTAALLVKAGTLEGYCAAVTGNGNRPNTEVVVTGGTLTGTSTEHTTKGIDWGMAIYNPQTNSTVTVTAGTLSGYASAIEIRGGTLNVTGGTLTATATEFSYTKNGNGNTTVGAAIAISQHTTKGALTVAGISGATLTGVKAVSITNPQNNETDNVSVTLGKATYTGELYCSDNINATVVNSGSTLTAPTGYAWAANLLVPATVEENKTVAEILGTKTNGTDVTTGVYQGTDGTVEIIAITNKIATTIVSVPFSGKTAADIVSTQNLAKDDKLYAYDKTNSKWLFWKLTNGAWAAQDTLDETGKTISQEATSTQLTVGDAFMLQRSTNNLAKPFYIYGTPSSVTAPTLTAGSTTLLANPKMTDLDLDTAVTGASATTSEAAGDEVVVPGNKMPRTYTFKDGKWGYQGSKVVEQNGMKFDEDVRIEGGKIPAGTGFWFKKAAGSNAAIDYTK